MRSLCTIGRFALTLLDFVNERGTGVPGARRTVIAAFLAALGRIPAIGMIRALARLLM